ncbi:hypothetical protein [Lysinibacillus parviboronicapiens]|nr:hypothetical protein [Lysinibacillus parviboronicapiens]
MKTTIFHVEREIVIYVKKHEEVLCMTPTTSEMRETQNNEKSL